MIIDEPRLLFEFSDFGKGLVLRRLSSHKEKIKAGVPGHKVNGGVLCI